MTGHPPTYTGWYFDLFFNRQEDGMRGAEYIADYFTSQEGVAYVGATAPRLGVFVVDAGGAAARLRRSGRARLRGPRPARRALHRRERANARPSRRAVGGKLHGPAAPPPPSSLQLRYDAETQQLVLTSDRALGAADDQGARSSPRRDRDRAREREERRDPPRAQEQALGAISIELGEFRDFVVADAYGEIKGQWGTPPPEPQ